MEDVKKSSEKPDLIVPSIKELAEELRKARK